MKTQPDTHLNFVIKLKVAFRYFVFKYIVFRYFGTNVYLYDLMCINKYELVARLACSEQIVSNRSYLTDRIQQIGFPQIRIQSDSHQMIHSTLIDNNMFRRR